MVVNHESPRDLVSQLLLRMDVREACSLCHGLLATLSKMRSRIDPTDGASREAIADAIDYARSIERCLADIGPEEDEPAAEKE